MCIASVEKSNIKHFLCLSVISFFALPFAVFGQLALADTGVIYGSTGANDGNRLITIDKNNGIGSAVNFTTLNSIPGLAITSLGEIFAMDGNTDLYRLDAVTANSILINNLGINQLPAIAFNSNDELYGIGDGLFLNDFLLEGWFLFKIDTVSANYEIVGKINPDISPAFGKGWRGMSFNPLDGYIYACTEEGDIHLINPFNAESVFLGNTGLGRTPDIAFDNDGNLYASVVGDPYSLALLDKTDGSGSIIGATGISYISGLASRILPLTGPQLSVFSGGLNFGLKGNGNHYSQPLFIHNIGTENLIVTGITLNAPFEIEIVSFPLIILPDSSVTIEVTFSPQEENMYSESMIISSNDPEMPEITIPIYGESVTAPVGVLFGSEGQEGLLLAIDTETGASDTLALIEYESDQIDYITEIEFRQDGRLFVARGDGFEELYSVNVLNYESDFVGEHPNGGLPGMDFSSDGTLYASYFDTGADSSWLVIVDQDNAGFDFIGPTGYQQIRGLTFSANGTLYGVGPDTANGDNTDILMTLDLETGRATKIGPTGFRKVAALEFGPDSVLYAGLSQRVENGLDGSLLSIDPQTGAGTFIGRTGAGVLSGLSFYPGVIVVSKIEKAVKTSAGFILEQNYPNPFNPNTTIKFTIDHPADVSLKVFNIAGQLVKTLLSERLQKGSHLYDWQASELASGLYFYQLEAGGHSFTRKAILIK